MKKLALAAFLAVPGLLLAQPQTQPLPGRYFTPKALYDALKNKSTEADAQYYLIGVYDLSQETGQNCATRGTTKPADLEMVYISYMDKNGMPKDTIATHDQLLKQTGAGYAVKAFADSWPCQK